MSAMPITSYGLGLIFDFIAGSLEGDNLSLSHFNIPLTSL
mgnify:CR=1 FL=1|jgi:hypothetical protein